VNSVALPPGQLRHFAWEHWILGYPGILLSLAWGLAEGTFFFIVPDVFLSYVAIFNWRRTWKHVAASAVGALLGGVFLFHWSSASPGAAHEAIVRVPFVREAMFTRVDEGFRAHGLLAIFLGSVSGIPYKLYAVEAPKFSGQAVFLLATPPARLVRFLLVWAVFGAVAQWLQRKYVWQRWRCALFYALIWMISYTIYWGRVLHQ
jgi:hypothetical protein